jgi:F-type H+-transporting ATPase subunit b
MHIDWWTLALQTINVLILVWILARFFCRPVADVIEKRRAAAAKLLSDASAAQEAVDADKAGVVSARAGFAAEREKLLAEARNQAESARDAMLQQATEAAAKLRAENESLLAHDRKAMREAMVGRAAALAIDIARKLLEALPSAFATAAILNDLPDRFGALPPKSRNLLAAAARGNDLDVITAAPLDEAQRAECQKLIEGFLGMATKLNFRADPGLIAGIEIRGDTITLKANWRDDLSRILQQLGTDDGQRQIS